MIDWARLWSVGERLASEQRFDPSKGYTDRDVVWALTREAAEVFKRTPPPGPAGYPRKAAMPEPLVEFWTYFATTREQITEGIERSPDKPSPIPLTQASVDRADVMLTLWQSKALAGTASRRDVLKALWAWAGGVRPTAVSRHSGIQLQRLYRCRDLACEAVGDEIKGGKAGKNMAYVSA